MTNEEVYERFKLIHSHLRLINKWHGLQEDITKFLALPYHDRPLEIWILDLMLDTPQPQQELTDDLLAGLHHRRYGT